MPKCVDYKGLWLPDGEVHLVEFMDRTNVIVDGKPTYQYHKLKAALSHVDNFGVSIDVGAHCGLWSMHLAKKFRTVYAFEPVHGDCFQMNCPGVPLYRYALGSETKRVSMLAETGCSGNTIVQEGDTVEMRTLDSFGLDCDFLKIDCEGYELEVLWGAREMLSRCHPAIIVEQKSGFAQKYGHGETEAVSFLEGFGYEVQREMDGDYILK